MDPSSARKKSTNSPWVRWSILLSLDASDDSKLRRLERRRAFSPNEHKAIKDNKLDCLRLTLSDGFAQKARDI